MGVKKEFYYRKTLVYITIVVTFILGIQIGQIIATK